MSRDECLAAGFNAWNSLPLEDAASYHTMREIVEAVVDAATPIVRADAAAEIAKAADELWAEIERHTFRYGGATEPGSVDPYLEERHAGLIQAERIARGTA